MQSKVEQWNKSAKDGVGIILFFLLEGNDFIQEKKNSNKTSQQENGITSSNIWSCRLPIIADVWIAKPSSYYIGWNTN